MRKIILYLFVFFAFFGFSQERPVTATVDTTHIRIGEQFIYKIGVDGTENVIIPKLNLGTGLEIVDSLKIDTIQNKLYKSYVLTGFDSGAFYIPRQQVFIRNQAFLTDSLLVNVATVSVDTTKVKQFEIKGIKNEPYQFHDFSHFWWLALLILIVVGVLVYFVFFNKKKTAEIKEPEITIPPFDFALQSLKELDGKLLWQNNKVKAYYSELTEILRKYIEDELDVPALESTTDDLVRKLGRLHRKKKVIAPNESLNKLKDLLVIADLVKFAKSKPLSGEIEKDRRNAEHIINNLKPKKIVTDENVE